MTMPIESTLHTLCTQLEQMTAALAELRITVVKDPPEPLALIDGFEQAIDDVQTGLQEAWKRLVRVARSDRPHDHLAEAGRALLFCQQRLDHAEAQLCALNSMDQLAPLLRFGRKQGGEWPDWARIVKEGIGRCTRQLQPVRAAQFTAWQEMVERGATNVLTVNTRAVGQINLADE
jgi:hypothetical protein